jgi:N-(5'phosphoribosyl)anthranilate (PRA) isomerase
VQFSGDEPAAAVAPFAARALKALRLAAGGHDPLAGFESCWGILLDTPRAAVPPAGGAARRGPAVGEAAGAAGGHPAAAEYGGTGRAWDYEAARAALPDFARRRVFLAGGLGPSNVRRVVTRLRPFAVDVCSGVETAPGIKDQRLLRQLFEEVLHAQAITAS